MSKHTPGPWALRQHDEHEWHIDVKEPRFEACVGSNFSWESAVICYGIEGAPLGPTVAAANARLIAAAPRMYERIALLAANGDAEAQAIMEAINGHS